MNKICVVKMNIPHCVKHFLHFCCENSRSTSSQRVVILQICCFQTVRILLVLFSRSCLLVSHTRRGNPLLVFPNGGMSEKLRGYFCLILSLGNPKRKKKKRIDRRLEKRDIFRLEVNQEHMKARPKSFSEQIRENSSRWRNRTNCWTLI